MKQYPNYKESGVEWLGKIPEHWEIVALKRVGALKGGSGFPPEMQGRDGNEIPFYKVGDLAKSVDGVNLGETHHSITREEASYLGATIFKAGAIAWAKIGAALLLNRRRIVPAECCLDNNMTGFTPDASKASTGYYFYLLSSMDFSIYAKPGAVPSFSEGDQGELRVVCPTPEEQTVITTFLDHETSKIDNLIGAQRKLIDLLDEKKQSLISHAVTKGLNPDVPMKESGVSWLGQIPRAWNTVKLGFLSEKIGSGKTPKGGAEIYVDEGVIFLRSQNIQDGRLKLDDVVRIPDQVDSEMSSTRVQPGDILLNITGASIGRSCLVPEGMPESNVNQHVCIIRLVDPSLRRFVALSIRGRSTQSQIESVQSGAARDGLNFEQIANLVVCEPPPEDCAKVVEYVDSVEERFAAIARAAERAIDLLTERRSALISAAVTGKIDVRGLLQAPQEQQALETA